MLPFVRLVFNTMRQILLVVTNMMILRTSNTSYEKLRTYLPDTSDKISDIFLFDAF